MHSWQNYKSKTLLAKTTIYKRKDDNKTTDSSQNIVFIFSFLQFVILHSLFSVFQMYK